MKLIPPVVDYRKVRPWNLGSPEFSHLKLLLFWPIFGILFNLTERDVFRDDYTPVYCPLDDLVPFEEIFVIPYIFWFVYLVGMNLYTLFYDPAAFRRLSWFIILTYMTTLVIYWIWPTCQNLRPVEFERDNVLTRFMAAYYSFDTNTNVCPSIHVLGSVAVSAAAWDAKRFRTVPWRVAFTVTTVLISISTVFLKQHSVIDVFAAIPLCIAAWILCRRMGRVGAEERLVAEESV